MASPPRQRDAAMLANGSRLLLLGGVLAAIGILLMVLLDGYADGIGVAFASLGTVPTVAGVALCLAGLVSRRSRAGKPFA
jgi:hypothetical protein